MVSPLEKEEQDLVEYQGQLRLLVKRLLEEDSLAHKLLAVLVTKALDETTEPVLRVAQKLSGPKAEQCEQLIRAYRRQMDVTLPYIERIQEVFNRSDASDNLDPQLRLEVAAYSARAMEKYQFYQDRKNEYLKRQSGCCGRCAHCLCFCCCVRCLCFACRCLSRLLPRIGPSAPASPPPAPSKSAGSPLQPKFTNLPFRFTSQAQ